MLKEIHATTLKFLAEHGLRVCIETKRGEITLTASEALEILNKEEIILMKILS